MSTSLLIRPERRGGGRAGRRPGARADRDPPRCSIAKGLGTLGDALTTVEEEHLRPLRPAVEAINAQFDGIIGLMPGVAEKAAIVAAHGEAMTLWWIGNIVLLW